MKLYYLFKNLRSNSTECQRCAPCTHDCQAVARCHCQTS